MIMHNLRTVLNEAQRKGVAIGHFNVSDWVLLKAVFASAQELKVPVIVGASENERTFLGVSQLAALVKSLREEENLPIFLNADHTHSLESAVAATKAGFACARPIRTTIRAKREASKAAVEALKSINPALLVEGEIGDIGTGSEIHDSAADRSKDLTTPVEAKQYVESTGVDILAPAVGNMHGILISLILVSSNRFLTPPCTIVCSEGDFKRERLFDLRTSLGELTIHNFLAKVRDRNFQTGGF
jgi:fructose-bisphosphate aldolase class II